ncbi:thiol-disulfide oxidoreductase ResA [mine drainage metagenome]|uniref:Thiol-disulfide oxidoreductase ResA n=1 Tax=mine drainage metagenome TaxID=410659 RepID=A0A1J5QFR9_9ZZZZ
MWMMAAVKTPGGWAPILLVCWALLGQAVPAAAEGFVLKDMAGKTHSLAGYKGKWVLVNYWATWCPPCQEEIPDLIALHEKRRDLAILGIALEYQSDREVRTFVDDNLMSYPIVLGDDKLIEQIGTTEVLPTSYIFNPQGQLVKIWRGMITRQDIEKLVQPRK